MPYKRGQKWVAQVRINGKRKEKIFLNKKEAIAWESESRSNPEEIWPEKTNTVSLFDWSQAYLDYAKAQFASVTYDEKKADVQKTPQRDRPYASCFRIDAWPYSGLYHETETGAVRLCGKQGPEEFGRSMELGDGVYEPQSPKTESLPGKKNAGGQKSPVYASGRRFLEGI